MTGDPTVSDAAQVTAALKELCKEEQLYIEGHKGRNFFGETPYGLDGQVLKLELMLEDERDVAIIGFLRQVSC